MPTWSIIKAVAKPYVQNTVGSDPEVIVAVVHYIPTESCIAYRTTIKFTP
jgi:hypothetical protein